jgi:dGTP triphosphohydrolase
MGKGLFTKYAAYRGRESYDAIYGECTPRTIFHHDRAEVTYSRYFRRMAFRQYHIANPGPDNRTRMLHCIEVATIASGITRRLGGSVELAEAIAYGHDIAQPPCGYPADKILDEWLSRQGGFDHGKLGMQVLCWASLKAQNDKNYSRLTACECYDRVRVGSIPKVATISKEALDGILCHTPQDGKPFGGLPHTLEGQIVRIADNLSYLSQEIDEGVKLDLALREKFAAYANAAVLTNPETSEQKSAIELLAAVPGCPRDEHFLGKMFDVRLGPRLMTMIRRIEGYNRAMQEENKLRWLKTKMTREARVPVLEYDPTLEFLIDFIWTDFIGNHVNQHTGVQARIKKNDKKIRGILKLRMSQRPTEAGELREFEQRRLEVAHYYPALSEYAKRKRVVAHHVAVLTTPEVDSILKKARS